MIEIKGKFVKIIKATDLPEHVFLYYCEETTCPAYVPVPLHFLSVDHLQAKWLVEIQGDVDNNDFDKWLDENDYRIEYDFLNCFSSREFSADDLVLLYCDY